MCAHAPFLRRIREVSQESKGTRADFVQFALFQPLRFSILHTARLSERQIDPLFIVTANLKTFHSGLIITRHADGSYGNECSSAFIGCITRRPLVAATKPNHELKILSDSLGKKLYPVPRESQRTRSKVELSQSTVVSC
jgi:hypothetical protein